MGHTQYFAQVIGIVENLENVKQSIRSSNMERDFPAPEVIEKRKAEVEQIFQSAQAKAEAKLTQIEQIQGELKKY